jgi:hypothetical protein
MKLSKLNDVLEEDNLFENFVMALEKFVIKNGYCDISVTLTEVTSKKIFNAIGRNGSNGFHAGKAYNWGSIPCKTMEGIENVVEIDGNDVIEIVKLG